MSSRTLILSLTLAATTATAVAAQPPPVRTPEEAIAAVKRVLRKNDRKCKPKWSRVDAEGYAGDWKVDVTLRSSRAGKGVARWRIGDGYPIAVNRLAKSIARGCAR